MTYPRFHLRAWTVLLDWMNTTHTTQNIKKAILPLLLIACSACSTTPQTLYAWSSGTKVNNSQIQKIVEDETKSAQQALNPKGIYVVVAEPVSGRILAMGGWRKTHFPELNSKKEWPCYVMFEPGSTFKPVVVVATLEKGKITPSTHIFCENGLFHFGGKSIKDHFPAGDLTYYEILSKSSNIGAAKMSLLLKDEDFYHFMRKFGFGEKTGISIPMEMGGFINPPGKWDPLTKTRIAFGQCIAVTPLQLTMAYCALCNGGKLMKPVIGEEKPRFVGRVCSTSTANRVKKALDVTASPAGTAPLAYVEGLKVGGKTGTAQAMSESRGYLSDKCWTAFVGFFPLSHPRYVITVVVDEADLPPEKNYGDHVAAQIFQQIAARIHEAE